MTLLKIIVLMMIVYFQATSAYQFNRPRYRKTVEVQKAGRPLDVVNASNAFCFSLLQQLSPEGNVFLSPISISMSMAIVYLGARDRTAAEMHRILRYEKAGLSTESVHHGFKQMMNILNPTRSQRNGETSSYDLETANALLVEKDFDILQDFKEKIRHFYNASAGNVNFATDPESTLNSINKWVASKTKDKIEQMLSEPLDPLTKLFLLNAVYFKGMWKTKFDQRWTMPDTFYNEGKIPKTVPMMRQKKKLNYGYVTHLKSQAIELPYSGEDIKMLILLPEKRDGLREMESKLTNEIIDEIPKTLLREVSVQVILPRFTIDEEYDLVGIFKSMGMNALFNPDYANLSGITNEKGLYVTKIVHKSVIDVTEEGSEAATITGVAAGVRTGGALHPLFVADHPFMFFIRDNRTNAILFVGRVNVL